MDVIIEILSKLPYGNLFIDTGLALHRGSFISDQFWELGKDNFPNYWKFYEKPYGSQLSVNMIKTLLYLEENFTPDEITNEY